MLNIKTDAMPWYQSVKDEGSWSINYVRELKLNLYKRVKRARCGELGKGAFLPAPWGSSHKWLTCRLSVVYIPNYLLTSTSNSLAALKSGSSTAPMLHSNPVSKPVSELTAAWCPSWYIGPLIRRRTLDQTHHPSQHWRFKHAPSVRHIRLQNWCPIHCHTKFKLES